MDLDVIAVALADGRADESSHRQLVGPVAQGHEGSDEGVTIDGAGDLRILWSILIPLLRAPILVVGVFSFIDYWSSFLWPLIVINDADLATISLGLQMFSGERGTDWGPSFDSGRDGHRFEPFEQGA